MKTFDESRIFRIDHYLGKEPVLQHPVLPVRQPVPRADLEPQLHRERPDHDGRELWRRGPRRFYEEAGAIRDVVQNHMLQVVAMLAMEPPGSNSPDGIRDEKVKVLRAIRPLEPGQRRPRPVPGYRDEKGVAAYSEVETFAAVRLADRLVALD